MIYVNNKQKRQELKKLEVWQDIEEAPYIEIRNLYKSFDGNTIIDNLNLSVYKTELFSLLGASGCGKTTLLRMLAGLEYPDSGNIFIDGVDVTHIPAYKRPVSMVFQSYALFPHMSVFENVAFGLKQEKIDTNSIKIRVREMLDLVHMNEFKDRKPDQLSGGQRQRVALARSLVKKPKLLLLDEPLAALDKKLREITQLEIVNIQEDLGITFVMVSHDQEEAMTMSSRICIMKDGQAIQVGTPSELYEFPNSKYVADFIGSMNFFDGIITEEQNGDFIIESKEVSSNIIIKNTSSVAIGSHVNVAIRPEKICISKHLPVDVTSNCAKGIVEDIEYLGDVSVYHVSLPSGKIALATMANFVRKSEMPITWKDEVFIYWSPSNSVLLSI